MYSTLLVGSGVGEDPGKYEVVTYILYRSVYECIFVNIVHCSWCSWNKHTVLRTTIHVQHLIMFKKETSVEPELRSIFQVWYHVQYHVGIIPHNNIQKNKHAIDVNRTQIQDTLHCCT